jgi:SagB-type dehydrogenase family enzyme
VRELITLPEPDIKGSTSLEQAIASRRSRRDFLPRQLTIEQIGQLIWAACGSAAQGQSKRSRYRTVPSAGATYPLELFVVADDSLRRTAANGLFHYLQAKHALEKLADEDIRPSLASAAWGQGFIEAAPLTMVFAVEFERTTGRYGQRGIRYVYMEVGHAAQNVHLQAEALGLGSVAVGAFDDAKVIKVLQLPDCLEPIYMVTVGYYLK